MASVNVVIALPPFFCVPRFGPCSSWWKQRIVDLTEIRGEGGGCEDKVGSTFEQIRNVVGSLFTFRVNEKKYGKCRGMYLVFILLGTKGEPNMDSTSSNFGWVVT